MWNYYFSSAAIFSLAMISLVQLPGCDGGGGESVETDVSALKIEDLVWEIPGTYGFNFEDGELGKSKLYYPEEYIWSDMWWEIVNSQEKKLVPINGSELAVMGKVDYYGLAEDDLLSTTFSSESIDYGIDFEVGDVLVIRTDAGNYYKFQLVEYDGAVKHTDSTNHIFIRYKYFTDNKQLLN